MLDGEERMGGCCVRVAASRARRGGKHFAREKCLCSHQKLMEEVRKNPAA